VNEIATLRTALPARLIAGWTWKTHDKRLMKPQEMATSHLFNTLLMIWNHTMPEECRFHPYKRWRLGYSPEYLKHAIYELAWEMAKRTDQLNPRQMRILDAMASWFEERPELLQ
jgi:hypothetical protein